MHMSEFQALFGLVWELISEVSDARVLPLWHDQKNGALLIAKKKANICYRGHLAVDLFKPA